MLDVVFWPAWVFILKGEESEEGRALRWSGIEAKTRLADFCSEMFLRLFSNMFLEALTNALELNFDSILAPFWPPKSMKKRWKN